MLIGKDENRLRLKLLFVQNLPEGISRVIHVLSISAIDDEDNRSHLEEKFAPYPSYSFVAGVVKDIVFLAFYGEDGVVDSCSCVRISSNEIWEGDRTLVEWRYRILTAAELANY